MRKAFHAFGFILYCGDIVFQLAMIQVCHRQRSEWSCQCGACHVGEQGGHGTTLLQNVEAEGVTIGMFGRSCVIANYRSPSSMHENKDELKGGWGHWFFWQDWTCLCMLYIHALNYNMFLQIHVQCVVYCFQSFISSDMGRHMSKRFVRFSANWVRRRLVSSHMPWSLVEASHPADLRVGRITPFLVHKIRHASLGPFKT